MDLGNSIDCLRPLYTQVWCRVSGRFWSESTNRAGNKQLQLVLLGQLYHIVKTLNVDPDSKRHVVLSDCGEEGTEVNQPVNPLVHHNLLQTFKVEHISKHKGTFGELLIFRLDNVRENDRLFTVQLPQLPGQASPKLTQATSDQHTRRLASTATVQSVEHLAY